MTVFEGFSLISLFLRQLVIIEGNSALLGNTCGIKFHPAMFKIF